jgi:hypothetical protein
VARRERRVDLQVDPVPAAQLRAHGSDGRFAEHEATAGPRRIGLGGATALDERAAIGAERSGIAWLQDDGGAL